MNNFIDLVFFMIISKVKSSYFEMCVQCREIHFQLEPKFKLSLNEHSKVQLNILMNFKYKIKHCVSAEHALVPIPVYRTMQRQPVF